MQKCVLSLFACILCSCTTITSSTPQEDPKISDINANAEQIMITNYGYYLFNCIPLGSGSNTNNSFTLFSDKVNLTETMKTFNDECKKRKVSEFSNMQVEKNSTCFFSWSPITTTLGIYWYKEIQLSATINQQQQKKDK